ncbi:MAG TPA: serine protease [Haliangiales bacterium]|nr:serine protease [Haliangiales bacterium]
MGRALILVWMASVGCAATVPPAVPLPPREEAMRAATVYFPRCGTGWMVTDHLIVTNRHVAGCTRHFFRNIAWVIFSDGSLGFLGAIHVSKERYVDLAICELDQDPASRTLELGDPDSLTLDDEVMSIGNPPAKHFQPNRFRVVARPPIVPGGLDGVIVLEGDAQAGESGSPIATADGKVVGVLFARAPGHAYAVPVRPYLTDLLESGPH